MAWAMTPVGQYCPDSDSPCRASDMTGNVWEWCSSLYRGYPYDANDGREDPDASGLRVLRGGSWYSYVEYARCAGRGWYYPDLSNFDLGFRLVSPVLF